MCVSRHAGLWPLLRDRLCSSLPRGAALFAVSAVWCAHVCQPRNPRRVQGEPWIQKLHRERHYNHRKARRLIRSGDGEIKCIVSSRVSWARQAAARVQGRIAQKCSKRGAVSREQFASGPKLFIIPIADGRGGCRVPIAVRRGVCCQCRVCTAYPHCTACNPIECAPPRGNVEYRVLTKPSPQLAYPTQGVQRRCLQCITAAQVAA